MGCAITELLTGQEIELEGLKGKILVVDAFNMLYQFLTTIRQRDGTPLKDSKGNITSHLTGLFNRTTKFMEIGMKLAFVFDGEVPELKAAERARRKVVKEAAKKLYKEAVEREDVEAMGKYAGRFTRLANDMIEESKELLKALGLPVIQAATEGEAQAAAIVKNNDAWAVVSQDADSFLFGADRVIKNLSVAGRRKLPSKFAFTTVKPQVFDLKENLKKLEITQDQLIALGVLIGTDFNPGGIKGIGPKKGLKLVKEHGEDFEKVFASVDWPFDYSWKEPFKLIKNMKVTDKYKLEWKKVNQEKVIEILCKRHDFSEERVVKKLKDISKKQEKQKQKGLSQWY